MLPTFPDIGDAATHFPEPESSWLEFKYSLASCLLDKVYATLCAFLNGAGGYMVFGVADDGTITGTNTSNKMYDTFVRSIDNIYHARIITTTEEPDAALPIGAITTHAVAMKNGKRILVITARPQAGSQYMTGRAIWHRLGASNFHEARDVKLVLAELRGEKDRLHTTLRTVQADFATFAKFAKDNALSAGKETRALRERLTGAEKEVHSLKVTSTQLCDLLFAEILRQKAAAEKTLTTQKAWSPLSLLCRF